MIVLQTDASTKEGYSCWCYHRSDMYDEIFTGIVKTPNSAAAELIAVTNALHALRDDFYNGNRILVITDNLLAVQLIAHNNREYEYSPHSTKYFQSIRNELLRICKEFNNIDALWVSSNNKNKIHEMVDAECRNTLNEYLYRRDK